MLARQGNVSSKTPEEQGAMFRVTGQFHAAGLQHSIRIPWAAV